jgi:hypothetical protein
MSVLLGCACVSVQYIGLILKSVAAQALPLAVKAVFLRNVGSHSTSDIVSLPRRLESSTDVSLLIATQ